MRWVALLLLASCGAADQPVLANAPRPDPAAVAGAAAAAAAAITLADPHAADRKPEKKPQDENTQGVEVKESVPADVLDRLDKAETAKPAAAAAKPEATPAAAKRPKGAPIKLPTPEE